MLAVSRDYDDIAPTAPDRYCEKLIIARESNSTKSSKLSPLEDAGDREVLLANVL
jgi:hypothetical protein